MKTYILTVEFGMMHADRKKVGLRSIRTRIRAMSAFEAQELATEFAYKEFVPGEEVHGISIQLV